MQISSTSGTYGLSSPGGVKSGQAAARVGQVVPALPPADDTSRPSSATTAQETTGTGGSHSTQALVAARQAGVVAGVSAANAPVEAWRSGAARGPQDLSAQRAVAAYQAVAGQERAEQLLLLGVDVFA